MQTFQLSPFNFLPPNVDRVSPQVTTSPPAWPAAMPPTQDVIIEGDHVQRPAWSLELCMLGGTITFLPLLDALQKGKAAAKSNNYCHLIARSLCQGLLSAHSLPFSSSYLQILFREVTCTLCLCCLPDTWNLELLQPSWTMSCCLKG